MKIAILGAHGMLGAALCEIMPNADGFGRMNDNSSEKYECDILSPTDIYYKLNGYDVVINCAGKPNKASPVNSLGPRYLSQALNHAKILHISTDCVFGSTSKTPFTIDAKPIPDSDYGISKLAGEVRGNENFTSIRTSFIGPYHGLLRWFLDSDSRQRLVDRFGHGEKEVIEGWARAFWTGSTVGAVAEAIAGLLDHLNTLDEIEHLATDTVLSKYDVLIFLREIYKSNVRIVKTYDIEVNRVLERSLELAPLRDRIVELLDYAPLPAGTLV